MKKLILFIALTGFFHCLNAQDEPACVPDSSFIDSARVVFPLPLNTETGEGGIEMFPACIGEPYELVFSFRVGDSASISGFTVDLLRAQIETTGAIEGLPEGINYFCNPPDCIFADTTLGCIVLRGTPTENNPIGTNQLVITAKVVVDLLGEITETIPGNIFAGEYNLVINEMGQCTTVGVNDYLQKSISLQHSPNPATDFTTIEVNSLVGGDFQFQVFDLTGKQMHSEVIQLNTGYNSFQYDVTPLNEGMYFYTLGDGAAAIGQKLVVGKR